MFATVPVLTATNESEDWLIQLAMVEEIKPHADVPVDPGAVVTSCCEARFFSGTSIVILIDIYSMKSQVGALTGTVDEYGQLT